MSTNKNRTFAVINSNSYRGLRCECGNEEFLTDESPSYKRFGYWQNSSTSVFEGYCGNCHSNAHPVAISPELKAFMAELLRAKEKPE